MQDNTPPLRSSKLSSNPLPPNEPPATRSQSTLAGRENLAAACRNLLHATRHLEDIARNGSKAELLEAAASWDEAARQNREARIACVKLLDAEVEAWMKE